MPDWLHSTSRNTVKLINHNHLQQRQRLEEMPQKTRPWRRDYTVDDNRQRLRQYIQGKGSDTVLDDKEGYAGKGSREKCDFCFSLMSVSKQTLTFCGRHIGHGLHLYVCVFVCWEGWLSSSEDGDLREWAPDR